MKKITQGLFPSSTGWTFVEQGATISASSHVELVTKVADFRRRNKFPPGDPLKEVTEYICLRNPGICKDGMRRGGPTPTPAGATFGDQVVSWISQEATNTAPRSVEAGRMLQRAEACRGCSLNAQFVATCSSCNKTPLKFADAVAATNPTGANAGLGGCQHYKWDNRLAIRKVVESDPKAPAGCWRKPTG